MFQIVTCNSTHEPNKDIIPCSAWEGRDFYIFQTVLFVLGFNCPYNFALLFEDDHESQIGLPLPPN